MAMMTMRMISALHHKKDANAGNVDHKHEQALWRMARAIALWILKKIVCQTINGKQMTDGVNSSDEWPTWEQQQLTQRCGINHHHCQPNATKWELTGAQWQLIGRAMQVSLAKEQTQLTLHHRSKTNHESGDLKTIETLF